MMRSFSLALTLLYLLGAALAYTSILVSPVVFWPAAFYALTIPVYAFSSWLVIPLAWRRFHKKAILVLGIPLLLISIPFIRAVVHVPLFNQTAPAGAFKVLSWNVASLVGTRVRGDSAKANAWKQYRFIDSVKADVLIFQEFYHNPAVPQYQAATIIPMLGYKYRFLSNRLRSSYLTGTSTVIFSKFPLINKQVHFRRGVGVNQITSADMVMGSDTIRVFNVHLASIKLSYRDQTIIGVPWKKAKLNMQLSIHKMRIAYGVRASQMLVLEKALAESPYPILLAGDLNETPFSYNYWRLHRYMNNSFEQAGQWFGFSYSGKIRGIRIDNQFTTREFTPYAYSSPRHVRLSDHKPQVCSYTFTSSRAPR